MKLLFRSFILMCFACCCVNATTLQSRSVASAPRLYAADNFQALMKLSNGDKSSLALIIGAAKQDLLKTQDWLANYYACNADKTKGIYWLKTADNNGSETAIDSILETRDLGRPTICDSLLQ